jgi:ATP-binding cassette subfamily D (ALD) long-chain fatty acid import protein
MALYMWWAVYSTYRGVIKPQNKKTNKDKSGASSSLKEAAAKETADQARRAGKAATGNQEAVDVDAAPVAASSSRRSRKGGRRGPRVEVDAVFFERLSRILAIVLPGNKRKLVLESFFLVFRVSLVFGEALRSIPFALA